MTPFIPRLGFRAGRLVFSPRRSSSFSNFAIMVLDVNFINPYETAGFLFFNDKEDAKKTANSVVKLKGCLIDVHVDINNLPPFPRDHQIQIKL